MFQKGEEMKNVIAFALVLGIFFAGCANGQSNPIVVSLPGEDNPDDTTLEYSQSSVNVEYVGVEQEKEEDNQFRDPDVIFVPTPPEVVDKMLELAQVKKSDLA